MTENDRTDALPRSGAVAGGFCGALAAVPLLAACFFKYYYLPNCKQPSNDSARFSPKQPPLFSRCKDMNFFIPCSFFYKFYSRDSTLLESTVYAGRFFKGFAVQVSQPSNP
jgi:hypothetical protein